MSTFGELTSNALTNKNVFSCVLNAAGVTALRIVCGKEFQIFGAEHEKRRYTILNRFRSII